MPRFSVNDQVIYHQPEASTHPSPDARQVSPAEHGDLYTYVIDQYWRVRRVLPDSTIEVVERNGRVHRVPSSDPRLEKAGIWDRLARRRYFPKAG